MEGYVERKLCVDGVCRRELKSIPAEWIFSRQDIEDSPSKKDGIDREREACLARSYTSFIQDLGMRLQVSQECIATTIVVCHRFFQFQSHAKNDAYLIATSCIHLVRKMENRNLGLQKVISTSTEILRKKSPLYWESMKLKGYCPNVVLLAQKMILENLGFDLEVRLPYKLIVAAVKNYKITQYPLAELACNLVNDGLRTYLFLQFKNYEIAAGAIFVAANFLKIKLPKAWWKPFRVVRYQLEEISRQLLKLYERKMNVGAACENESGSNFSIAFSNEVKILQASDNGREQTIADNSSKDNQVRMSCKEENQSIELHRDRQGDKDRGSIQSNLLQNNDLSLEFTKTTHVTSADEKKLSNYNAWTLCQVEEADLMILRETQTKKLHIDVLLEDEGKSRIQSTSCEHLSSGDINSVDKENIKEALKRRTCEQRRNINSTTSAIEVEDETYIMDFSEKWVQAPTNEKKPEQEIKNNQNISSCKSNEERPSTHLQKDGNKQKRKRPNKDVISHIDNNLEKRRKCSSNIAEFHKQVKEMVKGSGHEIKNNQDISSHKSNDERPSTHLQNDGDKKKGKRPIISDIDNNLEKRRKCSSNIEKFHKQVKEMVKGGGHDDGKEEGELSDHTEKEFVHSARSSKNTREKTPINRHAYFGNYRRRRNIYDTDHEQGGGKASSDEYSNRHGFSGSSHKRKLFQRYHGRHGRYHDSYRDGYSQKRRLRANER